MISLDFETRSELDITKVGAWKYSMHPSTQVLCMSYKRHGYPPVLWVPGQPFPIELYQAIIDGEPIEAHNAFFEKCVWKHTLPKAVSGLPSIPPDQWYCSAAKAAAHSLPRGLDQATEALNLSERKDKEGHKIMMKFARPQKITRKNKETWYWDDIAFVKLCNYNLQDVVAEECLSQRLRPLRPEERNVWLLDQKINERGIRVDLESVKAAVRLGEEYQLKINEDLPGLTDGVITKASQGARIVKFCAEQGVHVDGWGKDAVEEALKDVFMPEAARKVLEIRLKLAKSSVSKYLAILRSVCSDGRLRDLLVYHGAGTGRWAGRLVQPHNMPKNRFVKKIRNPDGTYRKVRDLDTFHEFLKNCTLDQFELVFPEVMEILSMTVRTFLIPSEGKEFFGGDFAAIEARVVSWCAGDETALDAFRSGIDVYKGVAAKRFYTTYEKVTDEQRALGKVIILACGFQMGHNRFFETCEEWGVPCTEEEAKDAVKFYRSTYPKVVQLWRDQEDAAKEAVRNPGTYVPCGPVAWMVHEGFLHCRLPSGRLLSYWDPKIKMKTNTTKDGREWTKETLCYMSSDSQSGRFVQTSTYGGKLVENFVQAIARDLMAHGMQNCEDAGYEIVLSVHDELLTEKEPINGCPEEFARLMSDKPEWAEGCPVLVEGWRGYRYLK